MKNEGPESDKETRVAEASAPMSPAARRALDEAEKRRATLPILKGVEKEFAGRGGAEPTRYGDWEVKGLATDF